MLVSIIVPVYNAASFLLRCCNSLLNQTHANIEIILIDDGSIDDSPALCDHCTTLDDRVKTYHQKNMGASVARNVGIDFAQGEYLMFVDADDFVEPDIVLELVNALEKGNVEMAVCSYMSHLFDGENELAVNPLKVTPGHKTTKKIISLKTLDPSSPQAVRARAHEVCSVWGRLYVTDIIKQNNLQYCADLSKFEDIEFNMKYLSYIKEIFVLNRNLYHYRVSTPQSGHSVSDKIDTSWHAMINSSYSRIRDRFAERQTDYLQFVFAAVFMGYLIRLFQAGSPLSFKEALKEVKNVSKSTIFKECMTHYYRPKNGSRLVPFFLKINLSTSAAVVAKVRMLNAFYSNKPIRQWCFTD
jgi:glycosyltransferase involved in cell wall biosynthesis